MKTKEEAIKEFKSRLLTYFGDNAKYHKELADGMEQFISEVWDEAYQDGHMDGFRDRMMRD